MARKTAGFELLSWISKMREESKNRREEIRKQRAADIRLWRTENHGNVADAAEAFSCRSDEVWWAITCDVPEKSSTR